MISYYNQRAREYEKVYEHPERQAELDAIKELLRNRFHEKSVLEVACGTANFDAGFAGFWWSHIPKVDLRKFLQNFHSKLSPGATVIFIDNEFKVGSSTPISKSDDEGNTYQIRQLTDGSRHEILKNFPSDAEIKNLLGSLVENIEIRRTQHYWMLEYRVLDLTPKDQNESR